MKVVVIIRSIELFDYIDEYNNNIVTKTYRLEISNIPYSINRIDVQHIYNLIWFIKYRYDITEFNGDIVKKMLNNDINSIKYNAKDITIMPANNYIDFKMSYNDHKTLIKKYDRIIKRIANFTIDSDGLLVNKVGIEPLVLEFCLGFKKYIHDDYEFFISTNRCVNHRLIVGYIYKELDIKNFTLALDRGSIYSIAYTTDETNASEYYSHVRYLENNNKIAVVLDRLMSSAAETTYTFVNDEDDISERLINTLDSIPSFDYQNLHNPSIIFTDDGSVTLYADNIATHPP